jgi:TonB family protein
MPRQLPSRLFSLLLGNYSLRILLGWVASLGLILSVLHLPVSTSQPRVGWTANSAADRISLTQISPEKQETKQSNKEEESPPPTRYAPPEPTENTSVGEGTGKGQEKNRTSNSPSDTTSTVRSIADLSIKDRQPEIIGGQGALSLHINYPAEARREGIEGRLTLTFTVDTDGAVRHVVVSDSLHPACDSAAVEALRSVRFRPGTYNGEPVPVRMSLPIRFQLKPGRLSSTSNVTNQDG